MLVALLILGPPATIAQKLVASARDQLTWGTMYDGIYRAIKYPGGDVDRKRGVCTDVIIRSYRSAGFDLQKLIVEHKRSNPSRYPGSKKVDKNIDHRRMKNQMVFFAAKGKSLLLNENWRPGDVVCWKLDSGLDHTGLVSDRKGGSGNWMVIHNMSTTLEEDVLTKWKLVGHFRYP